MRVVRYVFWRFVGLVVRFHWTLSLWAFRLVRYIRGRELPLYSYCPRHILLLPDVDGGDCPLCDLEQLIFDYAYRRKINRRLKQRQYWSFLDSRYRPDNEEDSR